jgi:hypothetical protein
VQIDFTKKSKIDRPCARRVSQTVSIRSAKREPQRLAEPKEFFRQRAAFRTARSAALFVGSMPSARAKVQRRRAVLDEVLDERSRLAHRVVDVPAEQVFELEPQRREPSSEPSPR